MKLTKQLIKQLVLESLNGDKGFAALHRNDKDIESLRLGVESLIGDITSVLNDHLSRLSIGGSVEHLYRFGLEIERLKDSLTSHFGSMPVPTSAEDEESSGAVVPIKAK